MASVFAAALALMIAADQPAIGGDAPFVSNDRTISSQSGVKHFVQFRGPVGGGYRPAPIPRPLPPISMPRPLPPISTPSPLPAPTRIDPPRAVVAPPPRPRCRNHPCAQTQHYQVETCRGGTCKKEWKHRCVAGVICR
jgi:hypothetical protein